MWVKRHFCDKGSAQQTCIFVCSTNFTWQAFFWIITSVIYCWTSTETFPAAKWALTGLARIWAGTQRGVLTWDALRAGLESTFGRKATRTEIHARLRRRRRRDEPILAYVQEKELLGAQDNLPENAIRSYIITGITDDIYIELSLSTISCWQQFLEALKGVQKQLSKQRSSSFNHHSSCGDKNMIAGRLNVLIVAKWDILHGTALS